MFTYKKIDIPKPPSYEPKPLKVMREGPWEYRWRHPCGYLFGQNPLYLERPCPKCGEDINGESLARKTGRLVHKGYDGEPPCNYTCTWEEKPPIQAEGE